MTQIEIPPMQHRTIGERGLLLGLSLSPIALDFLFIWVKFLRRLLALPLFGLMIAGAYWAGTRWYKLIRINKGFLVDRESGDSEERPDWFAFCMALLLGFGVLMFLRALLSHEMVRAYSDMMESPSDED